MKFPLIVLAVVVIGGIAVFLTNRGEEAAPTNQDSGGVTSQVPAPGFEGVEEMIVNDENDGTKLPEKMTEENTSTSDNGTVADTKVFSVSGTNFTFDVKEIRVKKGDMVTINFESASGVHNWVIDEFDAFTRQVTPGTPASVTFVADTVGTFEYYCSVGNHRALGMVGRLIVE